MFTVHELSCRLRGKAPLDKLSFSVATAEKVALLGRSFSGVNTLQEILCGFLRAPSGTVQVGPYDLGRESSQARRLIGYMPASPPVYPELGVGTYLELCAQLRELPSPRLAAKEISQRCGISNIWNKKIKSLSPGFLQLINVAQALVHDPVLLVLDDPMHSLDAAERNWLLGLIKELTIYKSLVFTTHNLDLIPRLCQRMVILRRGSVSFDGSLESTTRFPSLEAAFLHYTLVQEASS